MLQRLTSLMLITALAGGQVGCATKFVAKQTNPLKPARTPGWDPGELSEATQRRLAALKLEHSWKKNPAAALVQLEPLVARDLGARRAAIEIALAAGIHAHAQFLTDRGAAGLYLCAAEHAFDAANQGDPAFRAFCRQASRYALARLAGLREVAMENNVDLGREIVGPTRSYRIAWKSEAPGAIAISKFSSVQPCDRYEVVGARDLAVVDGVGTPLVGKVQGLEGSAAAAAMAVPDGTWLPLTATVEFGQRGPVRTATFGLYDRKQVETATVGGRRETLAGDFSTPFAVRTRELNQQSMFTLGILGFLRGDQYFQRTGLYPLEFSRTDKEPVVFVHGLISDPNDWRFLHNALLHDPAIRERYQFWAFYYPTSMAVQWSATRLRQGLANAQTKLNPGGKYPALNHMVLVGHSMGGLLSRMQIVSGGDRIYSQYFTKPVDQLRLAPSDRAMMKDMFFFEPNPRIDETIFICVPHQGSFLATNWIGKAGRMLARLPLTVLQTTTNILTLNSDAVAADVQLHPGTSIDSLSPGGKFATVLQELPMDPRVQKYSIVGVGKDYPPKDIWKTSDGVVPYWSSHIEGVPETAIPSNHSGPENEQCAQKVTELLKAHAHSPAQTASPKPVRTTAGR